jgi:hypothetical protein
MSPIPEFKDTLSENMKSDSTSVMKDNTETDRNTNKFEDDKHSELIHQNSEVMSRSAEDNKVSEGINPAHMAAKIEFNSSPENPQNEKPSQAGGSPEEEHWLEVSILGHPFVCNQLLNTIIMSPNFLLSNAVKVL